jgi:hypothetical protein
MASNGVKLLERPEGVFRSHTGFADLFLMKMPSAMP